jgi:DNA end-binding protein Ku
VWTGVLTFGLVTVPVALYTATEQHTVAFHQLQRGTSDRVRNKRVNERTGREVAYEDIVKGYELAEGQYVVVEPQELDEIAPGRSKTLDITGFVDLDEVDPIFFDRTYYLGPRGAEYAKVYELLVQALARSNRAGLAMFAMRGKEYLTAVSSRRGLLELHTMHFADEVRDPRREMEDLPGRQAKVSAKEIDAAGQLIETMAVDWRPEDYHDTYAEQVRRLVEDKAAGREIAVSEGPPAEATNVVDLMEVLQRSLEGARGGRGTAGGRRGGGRQKTDARRANKQQEDLTTLSKAELYRRATELDIAHRSTMTRDQLLEAVRTAGRGRRRAAS